MKQAMKTFILVLLMMLMLCCTFGAFAATQGNVVDDADLFTPAEEKEIQSRIEKFQSQTGMDFVLYTSDQPHPNKSGEAVAQDFYDDNGYGLDSDHSGVLYFIDMAERYPYYITTGKMIDYITDERLNSILTLITNDLRNGDFSGSVLDTIERTRQYIAKGIPEGQYRYDKKTGQRLTGGRKVITGMEMLFSAIAGLVVCLIIVKSVNHGYSLKGSTYSYNYAANSDAELTRSEDEYLRTTTTRVRKAENNYNNNGGGFSGGRRSDGSGVNEGSSGTSHGGGRGGAF